MAEECDLEAPAPLQSSSMAEGQTSASSKVVGTVLTMYEQCCINEAGFDQKVTFEDPAARTEGQVI
jgi:hypothetical protein